MKDLPPKQEIADEIAARIKLVSLLEFADFSMLRGDKNKDDEYNKARSAYNAARALNSHEDIDRGLKLALENSVEAYPALAFLRKCYGGVLGKMTRAREITADTARHQSTGFDTVVLSVMFCDKLQPLLKELGSLAFIDCLDSGIELSKSDKSARREWRDKLTGFSPVLYELNMGINSEVLKERKTRAIPWLSNDASEWPVEAQQELINHRIGNEAATATIVKYLTDTPIDV